MRISPCPFCDDTNVHLEEFNVSNENITIPYHSVWCYSCKASGPSDLDKLVAIEKWNFIQKRKAFNMKWFYWLFAGAWILGFIAIAIVLWSGR